MRDGQVYAMQEANARRSALLLSQWEFLETRQRAFEVVLRTSSVLERIGYLWNVDSFVKAVDAKQFELLEEAKRKAQAAAAKHNLTIVRTPAGVVGG